MRQRPAPVIGICAPLLVMVPVTTKASLVGPLAIGAKMTATLQLSPAAIESPATHVVRRLTMLNPLGACDWSATAVIDIEAWFFLGFFTLTNFSTVIAPTRLVGNLSAARE